MTLIPFDTDRVPKPSDTIGQCTSCGKPYDPKKDDGVVRWHTNKWVWWHTQYCFVPQKRYIPKPWYCRR